METVSNKVLDLIEENFRMGVANKLLGNAWDKEVKERDLRNRHRRASARVWRYSDKKQKYKEDTP